MDKKLNDLSMTDLSVLVIGAGAIGSYIGGSIILSGQKAVFLERPEFAARLASGGLRIASNGKEDWVDKLVVVSDLHDAMEAGPYDAALVAVKSYDTKSIAAQLKPFQQELPPIVCMQNGVENEGILGEALGHEKIIAGTLTSAIGKPAAGKIVVERMRGVGIAGGHLVSQKLVKGFNRAELNAKLYLDADSMKWSKLLTNILANATSAILDFSPAQIFADPGLFALESIQFREALAIMRSLKIPVVDLPSVPVRLLAAIMGSFPAWLARPLAARFLGRGRGGKMPSFHIDLYGGNPRSEVDFLNGAVVRFGSRLGIATPVNRRLNETLLHIAAGDIPVTEFRNQPEKLLAML